MLAVLDPLLFDPGQPDNEEKLGEVNRILLKTRARIPDSGGYWRRLENEVIRPLRQTGSSDLQRGFRVLHSYVERVERLPDLPPRVPVWDFRVLFTPAGEGWTDVMARLMAGCVLTGEETILITRLIPGRNVREHSGPGRCRLEEKTCWDLRVRASAGPPTSIPAICRRRNVDVPWTTRFDDRLPAEADGAAFPFCPPTDWRKASTPAFGTHASRPAWIDARGSSWACPATGWGYHWDVYLASGLARHYGLEQLNLVRWGAPPAEGAAGSLHHVPEKKRTRLRTTDGWSC